MEKGLVKLEDVIELLIDEGCLLGEDKVFTKVEICKDKYHCQKCGFLNDKCVCLHNELVRRLKHLKRFSCITFDQAMD